MRVRDVEEAIRLANDSHYGLDSSVFTADSRKGEAIARRIEAGGDRGQRLHDQLLRHRGPDRRRSSSRASAPATARWGSRSTASPQTILVTRFAPKREPHLFPYSRRMTKLLERFIVLVYGRGG